MMTLMPEMSRAQRVCRRFEQLQSEKGPTEAICQQIADYVVGRGDSLWNIAAQHYGDGKRYRRILRANGRRFRDPDAIERCQRVYLP